MILIKSLSAFQMNMAAMFVMEFDSWTAAEQVCLHSHYRKRRLPSAGLNLLQYKLIQIAVKALFLSNIIRKLWCGDSTNNIFSFPKSQTPTTVSPCFRQSLLTLDFHWQISLLCSFSFVMEHKYR